MLFAWSMLEESRALRFSRTVTMLVLKKAENSAFESCSDEVRSWLKLDPMA